jgi:hypothetical protein
MMYSTMFRPPNRSKICNSQVAALTRKCSGYRKYAKRCSTSNSQVRYASGLYLPSNGRIFNFSFATYSSSRTRRGGGRALRLYCHGRPGAGCWTSPSSSSFSSSNSSSPLSAAYPS